MKSKNQGITLIALIITIIVLLILAGVSIAMLTGQNGILNQANKAKVETEKANEREKIQVEVLGSYNNNGELDINKLKENLKKNVGIEVTENEFPISINTSQGNIKISESGEITNIGEYVSNGLMLYYDGRNNTSNGHSNDTNIWKDLSGNSHDGELKNGCAWEEDGLKFDGINDWVKIGEMNYENITLEVVALNYAIQDYEGEYICNYDGGGYGLSYNLKSNLNNGFQAYINSKYEYLINDKDKVIANKKYSLSGSYDGREMIFSQNGNKNTYLIEGKIGKPINNTILTLGTNPYKDRDDGIYLNR